MRKNWKYSHRKWSMLLDKHHSDDEDMAKINLQKKPALDHAI